jgi:hypothetical protein
LGFSTGRSGTRLSDPAKMLKPYFHLWSWAGWTLNFQATEAMPTDP